MISVKNILRVEKISVKNFKIFKDASIDKLSLMNVFIGGNGVGKSSFFDVFGFLSDALKENVSSAINRRGGFKEVISRGCSHEKDFIEIKIKFRNLQEGEKNSPLTTYQLKVRQKNGRTVVASEILKYRRGRRGKPWHFLDFKEGKGEAIINENEIAYGTGGAEEQREEQILNGSDILAISSLGQLQKFKSISAFRKLLEGWFVSNLQIEAARVIGDAGHAEHLSARGENLAQVTQYIYENHKDLFDEICDKMSKKVKGIGRVEAIQNEAGQVILKFKDGAFKDPFIARFVSDGTLKMFAYLILLHDPHPHPLLCIEEPENYLYPDLLEELACELRDYSHRGAQVFVTTHSPDFLDALKLNEVFYIVKNEDGYSTIKRAKDIDMLARLSKEGEPLGFLWRSKYFREEPAF